MNKLLVFLCGLLLVFCPVETGNATLWDRGGGLIYDDVLDITWLQDANYAQTSGYDGDGLMAWGDAVAWADSLVYGGYDDWRLSTTPGTTTGYINEGEMGHLYYDEGISSSNPGPFINVEYYYYWSGAEYASSPAYAWYFNFALGFQDFDVKDYYHYYAWAVRPGDVSAPVPEPATKLLLGSQAGQDSGY
jgi:hypothetical protein